MTMQLNQPFQAIAITDRVYWVGAIDWELRNFHGYLTSRGTTYNAFLIVADQITLVDTVKAPFFYEMMSRIASVIDPSDIKCVISNHSEMDHSGCLPQLIQNVQPERIIASAQGEKALRRHFHWDLPVQAVKDGERVDIGGAAMRFFETRMLHWPDSMFTYLQGDDVLFTSDAFGMHMASAQRFADQIDQNLLLYEAAKYYANILLPFSQLVSKLLDKLSSLDLEVDIIAPDHGPVWRQRPEQIVQLYAGWASQDRSRKAVVTYDTMWQSTANMALAIAEGLMENNTHVILMPLSGSHRSDVATELLNAGALVVGSPTINNQIYPTVADLMVYLKGLRPKNLVGAAFGSYGWSGEAVAHLETMLSDMGVHIADEGLRVSYVPDARALSECRAFGARIAEKLPDK